ncbi:MAG: hypothetical protein M0P74_16220 [Syntrophales bacterium]|nr:hypothetical protein [Syntrophales bacterium]
MDAAPVAGREAECRYEPPTVKNSPHSTPSETPLADHWFHFLTWVLRARPDGRAGRRAAVVRPDQEAEREPLGADGCGCQAAGGAAHSPATTDNGNREGGPGRKTRQTVHQAGRERRRGATPATATPADYRADLGNGGAEPNEQVGAKHAVWKENTARESARAVTAMG